MEEEQKVDGQIEEKNEEMKWWECTLAGILIVALFYVFVLWPHVRIDDLEGEIKGLRTKIETLTPKRTGYDNGETIHTLVDILADDGKRYVIVDHTERKR